MTSRPANDLSDDVIIRLGRPEDLAQVATIERHSFTDPWSREALLAELQADGLRLPLLAEVAGRVRGYLMAWLVADQLHILNIATDPELRRRGVATALLLAGAREAATRGQHEITLEVRRSNSSARAFYRRFGFVEEGVRWGYYADNGEDAIIMTCAVATLTQD